MTNNDMLFLNLSVYKILKNLNASQLSENQILGFIELLEDRNQINSHTELTKSVKSNITERTEVNEAIIQFVTIYKDFYKKYNLDFKDFKTIISTSLMLIQFKNDTLTIINSIEDLISDDLIDFFNIDQLNSMPLEKLLSLEYDNISINKPYLQRILAIISVNKLFNRNLHTFYKNTLIENNSKLNYKLIYKKLDEFNDLNEEKFSKSIQLESCFNLIISESISQSSRQQGGADYEDRVKKVIESIADLNSIKSDHDSTFSEVEYDFIFSFNKVPIGVSAKRTSRERYKQNIMDVENLDVDCFIFITLGTDLRETITFEILNKPGLLIVMSKEVYENEYKNNPKYKDVLYKIIPSHQFNKESLEKTLKEMDII